MRRVFSFLISLALAFSAGYAGSFFSAGSVSEWYAALAKPALNPPAWVFGPVWTVLYVLMAVAAWRIWEKRKENRRAPQALGVYVVHLFINALWSAAFFGFRDAMLALGVIVVLAALIAYLLFRFYAIDRTAGLLFVPYLAWVSFAAYLNVMIVLLNRR